ncbi:hypothetical protein TEA_027518 [Camellia sinensis var. sinensis]|uniref:Uncharacterized protein n=1 Tax=Camellia sinensis var. sinensis TaxID=542762 RepID=A0A4S4ERC6_CAMSN|nr:hypothetical protein TEA_027518 [Camellia sinensis var. sinensis]
MFEGVKLHYAICYICPGLVVLAAQWFGVGVLTLKLYMALVSGLVVVCLTVMDFGVWTAALMFGGVILHYTICCICSGLVSVTMLSAISGDTRVQNLDTPWTRREELMKGKTRTNLVGDDPEPFDFDRRSRAPFDFDRRSSPFDFDELSLAFAFAERSLSLAFSLSLAIVSLSLASDRDRLASVSSLSENYDHLNEALAGTDHSWTALTLKLCTALETANKLVQSTNSHVGLLSEKVGELESVIKRGDSAIAAAKTIHNSLNRREGSFSSQKL